MCVKGGMFFRHGVIGLNFWLMTMWLSFQPLYQSRYLFASPGVSGGLANSMHSALGTNLIAGSPPPTEWFNRTLQFVLSNRENLPKKIIVMIKNHTLAKFSIQCQYLKLEIVSKATAKPARYIDTSQILKFMGTFTDHRKIAWQWHATLCSTVPNFTLIGGWCRPCGTINCKFGHF